MTTTITLAEAKKLLEAAEAKATEMGIRVATAVVDAHGDLLALSRIDGSRTFVAHVAYGKAKVSALFQRPSDAFGEAASSPVMNFINELNAKSLVFVQGGLPIERDGAVIGAIGVSGGLAAQDEEVARAALGAGG
jgi:uncharacterized protein GlcG (DUF336 family)